MLGGGLEVALGCAWRIAASGTRFGLPEVNVGLVRGAGGTQRLPRLVGFEMACEMATSGQMVSAEAMLGNGGIDLIAAGDLQEAGLDFVQNPPPRPQAISARPRPVTTADYTSDTRSALMKKAKGAQAPLHNLQALLWATEHDFTKGQPLERALHLSLRQSLESRALRHAFFAERAAAQPAALHGAAGREITKIALVGGGLMGAGIATACLLAGISVHLLETTNDAVNAGLSRINGLLDGALKRGKI